MINVFVFHSTVGFKTTVVIVRVYKKIEKRFTYGVANGHMPCTLAKPKHFWLRNSTKFSDVVLTLGTKKVFIPKTSTLPAFLHY